MLGTMTVTVLLKPALQRGVEERGGKGHPARRREMGDPGVILR